MERRFAAVVLSLALIGVLIAAGCASEAAPDLPIAAPTEAPTATAEPTASPEPAESTALTSELYQELSDLVADQPGGVVAIHRHNGAVESIAIGAANADARSLEPDDRLRVGSISKPFVAVMVLQLVAEGSVELDAPLSTYLDTPVGGDASIRQLLSHRSGIPSYTDDVALMTQTMLERTTAIEPDEILASVAAMDGQPPGGPFRYSNTNYLLAGLLVEAVDGADLQASLERRITDPLGLTATAFEVGELAAGGVGAWSPPLLSGDPTEDYRSIASAAWAAGALVSTAPELLIFLDALVNDELLPKELSQEMTTTGTGTGYGLGVGMRTQGATTLIGHNGAIPGFLSSMEIATDTGDAVIVLVNNDRLPIDRIVRVIEGSR